MRPGGTLFALVGSLMLLLLLRLLWCPADSPARSRLLVEEGREDTGATSAALRILWSPTTPVPRTRNRYSEDDYLQIIKSIQRCPWKRQAEEYDNFRAKLASCCDAVQDFVVSQNNTPVGTNMSYEVESKRQIPIRENIFHMFPVSQPLVDYPYNQCAVVGNGGILNKSLCGAEIDRSDFVFRCNLPPITGSARKDVGSKTNLVTVNPSIITLKYRNLKENKAKFLEDISTYGDAVLLLPAFSYRANTGISFKVYQTLKESKMRQKVLFFHPRYLRHLALFWRTKGVTAYRLSTGLMVASIAVELCENVKLYGFWPFSKTLEQTPLSHHYYDNKLPKRGFHQMPKEYSQMLQLHMRGILKLQFSKCETP
ncbi:alpha-2,8-sialyltransferase 8F isoform X2 [Mastomys coucha]|uniref:alpha-2,8-sialyltransferase 8F isoform X2 n=1 Tax=Mastomys coucha TaxID=35658 RepID=UPI001262771A|nr:alpha-2,8-sialyltransferase 8F isoform X2 [Mastomys coucha]